MSGAARATRILAAVLVYNGREFVPACLESVARMTSASRCDVDVLVLDDCSPEPGWSEELARRCRELDASCYRSPRNLGIPRNMNLAALWAQSHSYDHVLLLNSDVVVPPNLADILADVAWSQPAVASVTAWSNNASLYSLPNDGDDDALAGPELVDWISAVLQEEFGSTGIDVPTGVGFCMLVPTPALREVGLLDPIYGRGYCEEVDWSLRAGALGLRSLLAPGTFVYHRGRGSTVDAGVVGVHQTSIAYHERIIDFRHPEYRPGLAEFESSGALAPLHERGGQAILRAAARRWGYAVESTAFPRHTPDGSVRFFIDPRDGAMAFTGVYAGFSAPFAVPPEAPLATLAALLGRVPDRVGVFDRGATADRLAEEAASAGVLFENLVNYPERV